MSAAPEAAERPRSEGLIVFLVAAIQFINILDFVIPLPLGPDLAQGLGFGADQIGLVGGAYTYAAAVSGLAGSFFLDRFDRRKVVAVAMSGLVLGTVAGGFARGLGTLMAARLFAGFFGGPATSVSMSIVADVVPVARRGKALSRVMLAFSVAQVVGTPLALVLARKFGWRAPFFVTAAAGVLVVAVAISFLPPMRGHLKAEGPVPHRHALREMAEIIRTPMVQLSYCITAVVMVGGFILIPNISAYVQGNLGFPRDSLQYLYLVGGFASFATLWRVGRLVDRYGSFRMSLVGALMLSATVFVGFIHYPPGFPVAAIFVAFMVSAAFRNVPYQTLASRVPQPAWRARFMSLQSTVQHIASGVGASASAWILSETADHKLVHIEVVAWLSILLTLATPPLIRMLEERVAARERGVQSAQRSALAPS
ncbi:MAG TPA: MFS transporter [Myxococcaceae bacterium]